MEVDPSVAPAQPKVDTVPNDAIPKSPKDQQEPNQAAAPAGAEAPAAPGAAGVSVKEAPRQSPKKPKKRKPKTPRDETAPRQPLTGMPHNFYTNLPHINTYIWYSHNINCVTKFIK